PNAGAGLSPVDTPGRDAAAIGAALAAGELTALYLLHADPICDLPGRATWDAALERATTVVAHAQFVTDGIREHATVVFPAESYAEKEGTLTHPDGRIQRLRAAIGHPGEVRAEWSVLADLARRLDLDLGVLTPSMASAQLFAAVPFYAGLTLEEIGGRGVRWTERDAASAFPAVAARDDDAEQSDAPEWVGPSPANGRLRLGTFRSVWNSEAVRVSPALRFLHPSSTVEISPVDAQRLKLFQGDRVVVGSDGATVDATVTLRDATPEGTVFMETTALEGPLVEVRKA
ncbi:MAG: molybdopterin-dependent oxidoreductase, partial [Actinomycetota bacterium]|nr:molybdopterin-dependent oxidoreductase [Actinomycetota bacterium]